MGVVLNDKIGCCDPANERDNVLRAGLPTLELFWGRANSYYCPSNTSPGIAHVLLLWRDLKDLDHTAYHTLKFTDSHGGTVTIQGLTLIDAECITPGSFVNNNTAALSNSIKTVHAFQPDPMSVFLVRLGDVRWLFDNEFYTFPINKQYNVVASNLEGKYFSWSTKDGASQAWDWINMLKNIWSFLPASPAGVHPAALPYSVPGGPLNHSFIATPAWKSYGSVMEHLSLAITLDPTKKTSDDSRWKLVEIGSDNGLFTKAINAFSKRVVSEFMKVRFPKGCVPEKVRTYFPAESQHYGVQSTAEISSSGQSNWLSNPVYSTDFGPADVGITNYTSTYGSLLGSLGIVWDNATAVYNLAGTLQNSSALDIIAKDRTGAYIDTLYNSALKFAVSRRMYSGVVNDTGFLPNEQVSGVAWYDKGGGMITEVVTNRWGVYADAGKDWGWHTNANLRLRPPDIGRQTYAQIYPGVVQEVFVSAYDSGVLWRGNLAYKNPTTGANTLGDSCFIQFENTVPTDAAVTGQIFKGRINGTFGGKYVFLVEGGAGLTNTNVSGFAIAGGILMSVTKTDSYSNGKITKRA